MFFTQRPSKLPIFQYSISILKRIAQFSMKAIHELRMEQFTRAIRHKNCIELRNIAITRISVELLLPKRFEKALRKSALQKRQKIAAISKSGAILALRQFFGKNCKIAEKLQKKIGGTGISAIFQFPIQFVKRQFTSAMIVIHELGAEIFFRAIYCFELRTGAS